MNTISSTQMVDGARDYRLMTRQVVDSILELPEHNRFSKGLFSWVGYDVFYLEYNNVERVAGKTSWSFWGLLHYSIDGIINFSDAPLSLATFIGFISFLISLCMSLFYALKTIIFELFLFLCLVDYNFYLSYHYLGNQTKLYKVFIFSR